MIQSETHERLQNGSIAIRPSSLPIRREATSETRDIRRNVPMPGPVWRAATLGAWAEAKTTTRWFTAVSAAT